MTGVAIHPIAKSDADSFHACLDRVAREKRFLALLEAPQVETVRGFVHENVERRIPQFVAKDRDTVVGWCDIIPNSLPSLAHSGSLGMGLLPTYRGKGLGRQLLAACVAAAWAQGSLRVELEVRIDNKPALRLYERFGFELEGRKVCALRVDGDLHDLLVMAILKRG
jgi:RimJ/RimL family protein N-acetyltransferase